MNKEKTMNGVFFESIDGNRRSVYRQDDNSLILADKCRCLINFKAINGHSDILDRAERDRLNNSEISFDVINSPQCPIDQHRRLA